MPIMGGNGEGYVVGDVLKKILFSWRIPFELHFSYSKYFYLESYSWLVKTTHPYKYQEVK